MRRIILPLLVLCGFLVGCGSKKEASFHIGVDPQWYPQEFGLQNPQLMGFAIELLEAVAKEKNISISLFCDNIDQLQTGLKKGTYDAIFSSMPPYNFHRDIFLFSDPFLNIGPVVIVDKNSSVQKFLDLKDRTIAVLDGSTSYVPLLQQVPLLVVKYPTLGLALNDLEKGKVQAVVMERVIALGYMNNLFFDKIRMVNGPLTDQALRLIALKEEKNAPLITLFNEACASFHKKGTLEALQKKWQLWVIPSKE